MSDSRAEEWLKRAEKVDAQHALKRSYYDAVAAIFYPERQDFLARRSAGAERYETIFDSQPSKLRYDLANQFGAMMRGRGTEWFRRTVSNKRLKNLPAVQAYCDDATETQRNILYAARSNFSRAKMEQDNDYVTFGESVGRQTLNRDRSGVYFETVHPRDIGYELSSDGEANLIYETVEYTGRKIGELFPAGAGLSQKLKDLVEKKPTETAKLRRVIIPVEEYEFAKSKARPPRDAKFVSLYIDPEKRCVIPSAEGRDEAVFFSNPYLIRRWLTVSGESWGRSPCTMLALADARMQQSLRRSLIDAIELATDPPKIAQHDQVLSSFNFYAGGVTFVRAMDRQNGEPIRPLQLGAMPNWGLDLDARVTDFLRTCFFQNIFKLPDAGQMTAYEVAERIEEYVRAASPVFEPMEADNARDMERTADLAERMGAFDTPPDEMNGADKMFEFETPVSIAQRKLRAQQAMDVLQKTAAVAAIDRAAIHRIDMVELHRDIVMGSGRSAYWRGDSEEAASDIEAENEAAQAQQMLEMAKQAGVTDMIAKGGANMMTNAAPEQPLPALAAAEQPQDLAALGA